ncbi:hypothetical protein TREES_T100014760 [Tupaia chinensis]|uniref:Uncharacterized protein n=1 Tax=Tupaia chinensis TaxID=246437 RepID=L9KVC6_TUPCH|nr:hypothetical protein TREES_T100014760 [Tupaia chinensis]
MSNHDLRAACNVCVLMKSVRGDMCNQDLRAACNVCVLMKSVRGDMCNQTCICFDQCDLRRGWKSSAALLLPSFDSSHKPGLAYGELPAYGFKRSIKPIQDEIGSF